MPLKTQWEEQPSLNLTPMIDIVFLLIIFFMVGTKFTELERSMQLEVPQVSEAGALAPAPKKQVINIYRDGRIALNNDVLTLEELEARLTQARASYSELGVIVRGDGDGSFQNVATVLGACRKAGVSDMGIAVRIARKE
ncbi:ExbD/TolR family protein [Lignipirellula cremea]|uniref:Biopolymer transport protein ExbD n=1 Tax=Lignipirellula cremea TaxID=2528010 RepID=A0A518DNF3_9BACT|nr:biopolymer transporter ExbD [Lignipirellula cremea]QDU93365.1 Biopolymer transport protein ExbD [Lignipirellula cremea]